MILYVIFFGLSLLSSETCAEEHTSKVEHNKRTMINNAVQNVNSLFDAILQELDATHKHKAELRTQVSALKDEKERLSTIQAELILAQNDLKNSIESENMLKNKLASLQQHADKELISIRNEFDTFKEQLANTTNQFEKVFW